MTCYIYLPLSHVLALRTIEFSVVRDAKQERFLSLYV